MGRLVCAAAIASIALTVSAARADDAGKRDFPATLVAEEPQVETEIAPQAAGWGFNGAGRADFSADLALKIAKPLGVVINPTYTVLRPGGRGFQALEIGAKYQFAANAEHEFVVSAAALATLGGLGSRTVGADAYTAVVPTVFYGKGAGDLPESVALMRPFALTGQIGLAVPTRATSRADDPGEDGVVANPYVLSMEGSLQYSLPYLAEMGAGGILPPALAALIPLIEYDLEIPVARSGAAHLPVVGTVNPGILWVDAAHSITWGLELLIPINRASGTHPGARLQISYSFPTPWPLAGKAPD